jgi:hypothetical protein
MGDGRSSLVNPSPLECFGESLSAHVKKIKSMKFNLYGDMETTDETSQLNIAKAAEVGLWLETNKPASALLCANCECHSNQLDVEEPDELLALKQFHYLLSQTTDEKDSGSRGDLIRETIKLFQLMRSEGVDPGPIPDIDVSELISLANEIKQSISLLQQSSADQSILDVIQPPNLPTQVASDDVSTCNNDDIDIWASDNVLGADDQKSFAKYLEDVTTRENEVLSTNFHSSLVDAIVADANANIEKMKAEVDAALLNAQSSQEQLMNYEGSIEKKRKQRIQILRDLKEHCCTCDGPHISKPPFSHGKDYRHEPNHIQDQSDNCLFMRKLRADLKSIDETLANYGKNHERYLLEIERRKADAQSKKEFMKDALSNSLRLLEIASDE